MAAIILPGTLSHRIAPMSGRPSAGILCAVTRLLASLAVAAFLEDHPKVLKIYYPGSTSHKQHELAKRQQKGFGSMVAFDVGSLEAARTVLESVRMCTLAESLGGVETLICHPATMTHASVAPEVRERLGITDGLVRISVGIEDTDDIIADIDHALDKIGK